MGKEKNDIGEHDIRNSARDYQDSLITDLRQAFIKGFKRPIVCLACGGGKTVLFAYMAEMSQKKGKTIWFLVHRQELLKQTFDTFEMFNIQLKTIHIGMIATYANHLQKYPQPDFIIFDECHFSMAATWQKIINAFPKAQMVGLTATPCRLDGKPLGDTYDSLVMGATTRELIEQHYLSDYKYYAPSVADLSGLTKKMGDYDTEKASEILMQKAVFGDVIKHYTTHASGLQAVCYCTTIRHSQGMAEAFQQAGINAIHFDGNTDKEKRKEIIVKFKKGEIDILCNVDLISVGFDCPGIECCILLRPTCSTALFIQQSCRALRFKEGKTAVILDHVNNYQRHGLPDDDREWSLDNKIKPRNNYNQDGTLKVRQCPECFYTFPTAPICPNCGYVYELTREELKNIKEIQLAEIKRDRQEKAKTLVLDYDRISDCKTYSEMIAFCKRKGYKNGYAYNYAKAKGLIR